MKFMKSSDSQIEQKCLNLLNQAIRTGNSKFINEFVLLIEKPIRTRLKRYIVNKDDIDDVLQKSLIKVIENYKSYDINKLNPVDWVFCKYSYGLIKHHYRNVSSKIQKFSIVEYNDELDSMVAKKIVDIQDPLANIINKEKFRIIHKSIFSLKNDKHQDVLILHNFAGIELLVLANWMNQKYATIKTWNDRAKSKLAEILMKRFQR